MDEQNAHNAPGPAGWWVAHRLLALMVERGLLSREKAVQVIEEGLKAFMGDDVSARAASALLGHAKSYYATAAPPRSE